MDSCKAGTYLNGLPAVGRDRYIRKLKCLYGGPGIEEYKDPYEINEEFWIDHRRCVEMAFCGVSSSIHVFY